MIPVTALYQAVKNDIRERFPDLGTTAQELWDPVRYACAAQIDATTKKQVMVIDKSADKAALSLFLKTNEEVEQWQPWQSDMQRWDEDLVGLLREELYRFFYPKGDPLLLGPRSYLMAGSLGRGNNLGSEFTDLYSKLFASELTVTSMSLYDEYRRFCSTHPTWESAEKSRSARYGVRVVDASKLGFVPKRVDISRVTCTEPTLNMWYQRGLSHYIEMRLRDYGINMSDQPVANARYAQIGSACGDFATTDLSSASDTLSMGMLKAVMPKHALSEMCLLRTPRARLPDGRVVQLEMLSTMGNGFTSSFQTAFFMCVVLASFRMAGVRAVKRTQHQLGNYGVFGDDIITPSGAVTRYTHRLLTLLGCRINKDKSFSEGPFRESCGGDFLMGVNVRPFSAKRWKTLPELYALYNLLHRWGDTQGIELKRTKRLVAAEIDKLRGRGRVALVPPRYPDDAGIHVPYYHAVRCLPKDENGSILIRYLKAEQLTHRVLGCDGEATWIERKDTAEPLNTAGALLCFVLGGIDTQVKKNAEDQVGSIPTRSKALVYRAARGVVPDWDSAENRGVCLVTGTYPRGWVTPHRT